MGLYSASRRSCANYNNENKLNFPLPKSDNFIICKYVEVGRNLVVKIKYLDCTNYEGNKIMVYKNFTYNELINQKLVDPHFSDNKDYKSPFVRFEPTEEGWTMALFLAKYI